MACGAILMACWNAWAFMGHILADMIGEGGAQGLDPAQIPCLRIEGWRCLLFYILKLDHLVSFPAICLFYVGLRRIRLHSQEGRP